jgi:CubicO group peptidase (beta-lactamase class C family)
MHYPIGSISKQFTVACVMLLVQDGKMRLDDPVARWFPELTRAKDVTVRMLLSHTSGYSDYAPQDYTIPAWTKPVDPLALVHEWAEKPLDFEPGTKWQYSNTNFVLATLILEKVSGEPFWKFLKTRVLDPLGLKDVLNLDTDRARLEPAGYMRNALAPVRPAILEAPGWYYGDASLAMPVADLLRWDISVMDETLLRPESYRAMETEVLLKNGAPTGYALANDVAVHNGHRELYHGGEVGGYVAQNTILPDDRMAVAVLTNEEASGAASAIATAIVGILEAPAPGKGASAAEGQVKAMLDGLEDGRLDRSALTSDCSFYFSDDTVRDFATSLKPLGAVTEVKQTHEELRGGMTFRIFAVSFGEKKENVTTYAMPDGKLEQFLVEAE